MAPNDSSRRLVRIAVYAMLLASAAATLLLGNRLWSAAGSGTLPLWTALVPSVTFTAFVIVYSVDRYLLVRRRNYPMMRALVQVTLAIVFLSFLVPQQASELRQVRRQLQDMNDIDRLLAHRDARVRAAACELVAWRGDRSELARLQALAANDKKALVRAACGEAAARLRAQDETPPPAPSEGE